MRSQHPRSEGIVGKLLIIPTKHRMNNLANNWKKLAPKGLIRPFVPRAPVSPRLNQIPKRIRRIARIWLALPLIFHTQVLAGSGTAPLIKPFQPVLFVPM